MNAGPERGGEMRRTNRRTCLLLALVLLIGCSSMSPRAPAAGPKTPIGQEQLWSLLLETGPMPKSLVYTDPHGTLDLSTFPSDPFPAQRLATVDLARVTVLHLGDMNASSVDLLCPRLDHLRELSFDCRGDLSETEPNLGDSGALRVIACPALKTIRSLSLPLCGVGDETARAIARADFPELTTLNLGGGHVGDLGAEALARSPVAKTLNDIGLWASAVGDRGIVALVGSGILARAEVDLSRNYITDEGAQHLLDLAIEEVKKLDLASNMQVTQELSSRLDAKFGDRIETPW